VAHLNTRVLAALCAAFAGACSTSFAASPSDSRPDAMVRIDARPGEYQLFRGSLDAEPGALPKPIRFEIELQKLQPSPKWSPTLNLCLYAGQEDQVTCLKVLKLAEFTQLVPRIEVAADRSAGIKTIETAFLLQAQAAHTVDVEFSATSVTFRIGGRLVHQQPVTQIPDAYYFSCSSAVCAINIYQPPGRP